MVLAMLLAHLVGDYILQWDTLSRWKGQSIWGVLVHGSIVTLVTLLFALPFDRSWWPWALFIGVTHTLIDALELPVRGRMARREARITPATLFIADQMAHLSIILLALIWSGYLVPPALGATLVEATNDNRVLAFLVAYAFLTMPAWIVTKFAVYGLVKRTAPEFSQSVINKYAAMVERGLIATFVLTGQFILVPIVALPRVLFEWPQMAQHQSDSQPGAVYWAELFTSIVLAVVIGLGLRRI